MALKGLLETLPPQENAPHVSVGEIRALAAEGIADLQGKVYEGAPELIENLATEIRKVRRAQSDRAKKLRGKIGVHDESMRLIVSRIVSKPCNQEKSASDLWPALIGELHHIASDPEEIQTNDPTKAKIRYYTNGGLEKEITFKRFRNLVSGIRKER